MAASPPAAFAKCPCGSGTAYGACCRPLHHGQPADTAEALMRSRYAAYAVGDLNYVFRTWDRRTRPVDLAPSPGTVWEGLEVIRTAQGGPSDDTGLVEFRALFRTSAGRHTLHETSRFERRLGRWTYVDGEVDARSTQR
jgi:SEC-C motif-containing protein